jgi:hypothetical protein
LEPKIRPEVTLGLRADEVFLPLAVSFTEKAAQAFGMDRDDSLSLSLATEEIFAYLCHKAAPDREVRMWCRDGRYYVEAEFLFRADDFDMRAFNLTACPSFEDDACVEETRLLIASRMVERFRFAQSWEEIRLTLVKEKTYPPGSDVAVPPKTLLERFSVRAPDPEELKMFVLMAAGQQEPHRLPAAFNYPGMVADMAASGEYSAAVAVDRPGEVGGGILWRRSESYRAVQCFGPYVFQDELGHEMASALIDACIGAVAKTDAIGIINTHAGHLLPPGYFERLGTLSFRRLDGSLVDFAAYYRQLDEDLGTTVWCHPDLQDFLDVEYKRLVMPRRILPAGHLGEGRSPFSVLSSQFDRSQGYVVLRPVWWGTDAHQTVADYIDVLRKERIPEVLFELDLGRAWQALFTPALLSNGFEPRMVLPYGGRADLVVFQLAPGADD